MCMRFFSAASFCAVAFLYFREGVSKESVEKSNEELPRLEPETLRPVCLTAVDLTAGHIPDPATEVSGVVLWLDRCRVSRTRTPIRMMVNRNWVV